MSGKVCSGTLVNFTPEYALSKELIFTTEDEIVNKPSEMLDIVKEDDSHVPPNVFISYSWDNEEHKEWVLKLANRLRYDGVNAVIDRYHLNPGKNMQVFMETSLRDADKVLLIFTPEYKARAEGRKGGVGYETTIVSQQLYKKQDTIKFIPVLRSGDMESSMPDFIQAYININARDYVDFEVAYDQILRAIFEAPAIKPPPIGNRPTFDS